VDSLRFSLFLSVQVHCTVDLWNCELSSEEEFGLGGMTCKFLYWRSGRGSLSTRRVMIIEKACLKNKRFVVI
jgi:hypothetical protein